MRALRSKIALLFFLSAITGPLLGQAASTDSPSNEGQTPIGEELFPIDATLHEQTHLNPAENSVPEGSSLLSLQSLLGLNPTELHEHWGPPEEYFYWENNGITFIGVRFYGGQTGFFHKNRLWMIRLTQPYSKGFSGLSLGISPSKAAEKLGRQIKEGTDWSIPWDFPGFPVNLRLIFSQDRLVDFYLYRKDY